ncbi:MAG: hypothetical protein K6E30_10500 [Lachnospiraceae bacterium]|nr:hypothetical protein [Lachnospiraceae bacterium]
MSSKLMKRIGAAAMSGILAASMVVGMGAPVLAGNTISADENNQIGIDKVLRFAYGAEAPALTFVFDVTPISVNGEAYDAESLNMPLIDQLVSKFSGGDTSHQSSGEGQVSADGLVTVVSEYILDLDDVPFTHAGVYEYQVKENKDASISANAAALQNMTGTEVSYSDSAYTLKVGVQNGSNGEPVVTDIVVTAKTSDIVVTDSEGNPVDSDGDGVADTISAVRDLSSDSSTDKADNTSATGANKIDAAPSNPYGSQTDGGDASDKAPNENGGNSADLNQDDNVNSSGEPEAGTADDGTANASGDRPELAEKNGMTFTNTLTQILGSEEKPDEGQDMDNDPTDDPKENDPSDPTTSDGGHEDGEDEAANYQFYVGKDVTGAYGDLDKYFDFTLTLTKSALQTGEASYYAYIVTRDSSDETGVWSYTTAGSSDLGTAYDSTATLTDNTTLDAYKITTGTPFSFKLKANQRLVFTRIGTGIGFKVEETGVAVYKPSAVVTSAGVQIGTVSNLAAGADLSTGSVSNAFTGAGKNAVDVTNNNETTSPTGIVINNLPYILVALLVAAALAGSVVLKSRKRMAR